MVKNLPAKQEMRVQPLGWEEPLEKEMVTHSSILAWRISWTEEPDCGVTKSRTLKMKVKGAFLVAQMVKNMPAV